MVRSMVGAGASPSIPSCLLLVRCFRLDLSVTCDLIKICRWSCYNLTMTLSLRSVLDRSLDFSTGPPVGANVLCGDFSRSCPGDGWIVLNDCCCVDLQVLKTFCLTAASSPVPPWTWSHVSWTSDSTLPPTGASFLVWLPRWLPALSSVHLVLVSW